MPPPYTRRASPRNRRRVLYRECWRPVKAQLIELIALLEAGIDFAEDDISVAPTEEILRRLGSGNRAD